MNDPLLLHPSPGLSDLSAGPLLGARYPSQGAEMSHTPGPWKAVLAADISGFDDDHGVAWIESASGETVMATDSGRINQNEDNARLIAAAPDLLAALESLLAVCVEELDDKRTPEMRQARNAIAKAKRQA